MTKDSLRRAALLVACAFAGAAPLAGCTEAWKKAQHVKRGDAFVAEGKFREAVIEYRNVLQIDPKSPDVNRKLGLAAFEAGDINLAFTFLQRALQQDPADIEVRLKLGALYVATRELDKAREQASYVLARQPDNFVAAGIVADSAKTPEEIDKAIAMLQDRPERFQQREKVERALGVLYARKSDPASAEAALQASIAAKPDSPDAHSTLARLYLAKGMGEEGEKELRAAASLASPGSAPQIELVDFLLSTGRAPAAKTMLWEMVQKAPDAYGAWFRLADLAFQEKRVEEAANALAVVLKAQPNNAAALALRARLELARGETKQGLETASLAVRLNGSLAMAHHALALAHLQSGNASQARNSANDAVARAPRYPDAVSLAADLATRAGDHQGAAVLLRAYIEQVPNDPRPHLQLGTALLQANDVAHARASLLTFAKMAPSDPRGPLMLGMAARVEGKLDEAGRYFEEALSLGPGSGDALRQLVDMSLRDKQPAAALERAKRQADLAPSSAEVAFVLAGVYLASGQKDQAEKEFLRVIELKPDSMAAYGELASLYGNAKDYSRATAMVEKALARDPNNAGMLMLSAVLSELQGATPKARELYEKILARQPKFATAANNLAFILAEEGKDLKRAQTLAQVARDAAPADPDVADTLGWVLFKQGAYPGALTLFKESLEKRPDNPEVLRHLGLAYDKLREPGLAKHNLRKALELSPNAAWAAEAKAILEAK